MNNSVIQDGRHFQNGRPEKSILDHFFALDAHLTNPVCKKMV